MAFIYMSGGYVINVPGTRGEIANRLSDLHPGDPFVEMETQDSGSTPAVPVIVNGNQVVVITEQPLPSSL
jgi:hypothetical protein